MWGRANVINFLAGRPQPTRFHHNVVLIRDGLPASLIDHWDAWFEEEVTGAMPQACLINLTELDGLPAPWPRSATFLRGFLDTNYTAARTIGLSVLYLRNDG